MKNNKSHLVLVPTIGIVSFMFSHWIMKSNQADVLLGFSSDALGGLVLGLGIGVMIVLLRIAISKNNEHCNQLHITSDNPPLTSLIFY